MAIFPAKMNPSWEGGRQIFWGRPSYRRVTIR